MPICSVPVCMYEYGCAETYVGVCAQLHCSRIETKTRAAAHRHFVYVHVKTCSVRRTYKHVHNTLLHV